MNMKQISKDIRSGSLLEENIPQLFNHLANHYNNYSEVRLAMHYFAFYEAFCDDENNWSKDAMETTDQINKMIKDHILQSQSGEEREEAVRVIDKLRKDITKRMDILTAYTDIFQTYEYVLNRLEYRFYHSISDIDEEEFAKEILRFIFETNDNIVVNDRIKDIVGQLPVRITKQKYFELIKGSINAYLGSDVSSLDSFLYMLRTSAMLYHEDGMKSLYPKLWEKKEQLSDIAFKNISKEGYDQALNMLEEVTVILEMETTLYYSLEEIANEVYALLLCAPYSGMVPTQTEVAQEAARQVLRKINKDFLKLEKQELPEELYEQFTDMEGVQEELFFEISTMEDALYEAKMNHTPIIKSLMLEPLLQVLLLSKDLLSNSLFINLEEAVSEEEIVDEDRVEKEVKALDTELLALFEHHDRMVSRAVMANTISRMPVFFADHKEVMDYVRYSLDRCSDKYEKAACIEIIKDMMEA